MVDLITRYKMTSFRVFPTPDPPAHMFIKYTWTEDS